MEAVEEAGLDAAEAKAFLETDELWDHVWKCYHETIYDKGIDQIPFFYFSHAGRNYGVQGSANVEAFLQLFEQVRRDADGEVLPGPPTSFFQLRKQEMPAKL